MVHNDNCSFVKPLASLPNIKARLLYPLNFNFIANSLGFIISKGISLCLAVAPTIYLHSCVFTYK